VTRLFEMLTYPTQYSSGYKVCRLDCAKCKAESRRWQMNLDSIIQFCWQ